MGSAPADSEAEARADTGPADQQPSIPEGDRYCRKCLYCIGDLTIPEAPEVCPECGARFDKTDPKSTLDRPQRPKSVVLRWPILAMLGVMLLVFLAKNDYLPMPLAGSGGTLWDWRYDRYGYRDGLWWWKGDAYGTTTILRDDMEIEIELHAGIARRVTAHALDDGRHAFTVERKGNPPVWSLRIDDHDLAWPPIGTPELIRAVNYTREHRFGVLLYTPRDTPRRTPDGPIIAQGTEADILWAYVNAYGLIMDFPERVPRRSDGWHPTLPEGVTVEYPPQPEINHPGADRPAVGLFRGR